MVRILGTELNGRDPDLIAGVGFTPDTPPVYEGSPSAISSASSPKATASARTKAASGGLLAREALAHRQKRSEDFGPLSRDEARVGIARTMLPNPHVVLLDEPAAGIDPAGRVQFRQLLLDLRRQGKALIVSSHILSDMAEYCSHIGIMAKGALIRFGTVADVAAGVHSTAIADRRCRYRLVLAQKLRCYLTTIGNDLSVSAIDSTHDTVGFDFASDLERSADLLSRLVGQGISVASFSPEAHDLEAAYLQAAIGQVD